MASYYSEILLEYAMHKYVAMHVHLLGSIQCSLFCGGQSCKYETPLHWGVDDKALRGLYSHWITERILAMARPSTFLFKVFDLIGQFKRWVWQPFNILLALVNFIYCPSTATMSVISVIVPWKCAV